MNCEQAQEWMSEYLDDMLDARCQAELMRHIEICGACRRVFDELRQTVSAIRALEEVEPPEDLLGRVRGRLASIPSVSPGFWRIFALPQTRVALAACLLLALGIYAYIGGQAPRAPARAAVPAASQPVSDAVSEPASVPSEAADRAESTSPARAIVVRKADIQAPAEHAPKPKAAERAKADALPRDGARAPAEAWPYRAEASGKLWGAAPGGAAGREAKRESENAAAATPPAPALRDEAFGQAAPAPARAPEQPFAAEAANMVGSDLSRHRTEVGAVAKKEKGKGVEGVILAAPGGRGGAAAGRMPVAERRITVETADAESVAKILAKFGVRDEEPKRRGAVRQSVAAAPKSEARADEPRDEAGLSARIRAEKWAEFMGELERAGKVSVEQPAADALAGVAPADKGAAKEEAEADGAREGVLVPVRVRIVKPSQPK